MDTHRGVWMSIDFRALLKAEREKARAAAAAAPAPAAPAPTELAPHESVCRASDVSAPAAIASTTRLARATDSRQGGRGPSFDEVLREDGTTRTVIDLTQYSLQGPPDGVYYIPDFVEPATAERILTLIGTGKGKGGSEHDWVQLRGRRLQCFGGDPNEHFQPQPLPRWLSQLCQDLVDRGVFEASMAPDHVLVNEYQPGEGIMPHTDGPFYVPRVAILSLGSPAIFHFQPRLHPALIGIAESEPIASVVLQPNSLLIFTGEAYNDCLHCIKATEREVVGDKAPCINLAASRMVSGALLERKDVRLSLTIRKVAALP